MTTLPPNSEQATNGHTVVIQGAQVVEEESIDLLEVLVRVIAEWQTGVVVALVVVILGTIYTMRIPPQFEATATILPKQTFAESNSLVTLFSGRHPEDLYTGLLKSRSVTDNVIRSLGLVKTTDPKEWEAERGALLGSQTVLAGADGLLRITIRNTDAQMATRITNAYLDGLHIQQQTMALSQSVLNRQFFEMQLAQEKDALVAAENDLEKTEVATGIVQAGAQTSAGLSQIAAVRSQITGLEVQLAGLLQGETEDAPQVKTLRSQIAQMQAQERQMEAAGTSGAGAPIPAGRMPAANLEYERKKREVTFHEGLLTSLSSQYQNARLVEASSVDAFQVVDYAIVPERRSFPPRKVYLLAVALIAAVLGLFAMFFMVVKRKVQADSDYQRHMLEIRRIFGFSDSGAKAR